MKTRTWKILAATMLLVMALPLSSWAQFTYTTNNGTITITGYTGPGGDIVIPSSTNGYPVTTIGGYAFDYQSALTSVTIPNSITNIGPQIVFGCSGLTSMTVPDSVISIGVGAFQGCSNLTNITVNAANPNYASAGGVLFNKTLTALIGFPGGLGGSYAISNSVTSIAMWAFQSCANLTSVTIPGSVTSIGTGAFEASGLTSVTIPDSVTSIASDAFDQCSSLMDITVGAANPNYASVGGVLFDKTLATLIEFPGGLTGSYTISNSVTSIGVYAFQYCSGLTSVTIPDSVTSIGDEAFAGCSLTNVTIGNNVASIGYSAFWNCYRLTSVTIPASVTGIGSYAFQYCYSLTNAYFLGNAPTVNGGPGSADTTVFNGESGTAYYVSGTTGWGTTFGGWPTAVVNGNTTPPTDFTYVMDNGAITITGYTGTNGTVTIPGSINGYSVTAIGDNAFNFVTILTDVTIPNSVTNIGFGAFEDCYGLTNATIGTGVINIGDWAFDSCFSLPNVIIPGSVTSIGNFAFDYCGDLTSITIPSAVASIGTSAFGESTHLTSILVNAGNSYYASASGILFNKAFTALVQCPAGLTGSYAIPSSVAKINSYAFDDCNLTSVTIPNSVTNIGKEAFSGCENFTSVTIPSSVTSIGEGAFMGEFTLSPFSGVTSITVNVANPNYASVGGVLFNKSLTTLIQYPSALTGSYSLPSGVINISNYAFWDCLGLTSVTIPESLTNIGSYAFEYCSHLTSVTIGNSVTSIGIGAFNYCSGLTSVTIPSSVTSIGGGAFSYCSSLTSAYFLGNAPTANGGPGSADTTVFSGDSGTAYYVPGTTGWSTAYGGCATAEWFQPQPQILGSGSGLGVGSQGFQFTISWATNATVVVEASTNLQDWIPISTNTLVNGTSTFLDSAWTKNPQRFYRVRLQ